MPSCPQVHAVKGKLGGGTLSHGVFAKVLALVSEMMEVQRRVGTKEGGKTSQSFLDPLEENDALKQ